WSLPAPRCPCHLPGRGRRWATPGGRGSERGRVCPGRAGVALCAGPWWPGGRCVCCRATGEGIGNSARPVGMSAAYRHPITRKSSGVNYPTGCVGLPPRGIVVRVVGVDGREGAQRCLCIGALTVPEVAAPILAGEQDAH